MSELLHGQELATPLRMMLVLTALAFLPALILSTTSFVRMAVVLGFVRQGIGSPQSPPTQVIIGLSLFLTAFTMAPTFSEVRRVAFDPWQRGEIGDLAAIERAAEPVCDFMLRQTREEDLRLFYDASHTPLPESRRDVSLRMVLPAFVISELTTAFQMGAMILLPFLVVDLAVASLLMSMGMMMVPPNTLSLPIKLVLFVLVDGWHLLAGSLLRSYT